MGMIRNDSSKRIHTYRIPEEARMPLPGEETIKTHGEAEWNYSN